MLEWGLKDKSPYGWRNGLRDWWTEKVSVIRDIEKEPGEMSGMSLYRIVLERILRQSVQCERR